MSRISPAFASLLSLLLPGLGHWYTGSSRSALLAAGLFLGLAIVADLLIFLLLPPGWFYPLSLPLLIATLLLYLAIAIHSWRRARERRQQQHSPRLASLLPLLAGGWLLLIAVHSWINTHIYETFTVPSSSMVPTILPGDMLIADKRIQCRQCQQTLHRGDIVTFVYPDDRRQRYIKRVIGLPGDTVRLADRQLSINDIPVPMRRSEQSLFEVLDDHQYRIQWEANDDRRGSWQVPHGQLFVLGDNRSHSQDSRVFGFVPLQDVEGLVSRVWFSRHPDGGFRTERAGLALQ